MSHSTECKHKPIPEIENKLYPDYDHGSYQRMYIELKEEGVWLSRSFIFYLRSQQTLSVLLSLLVLQISLNVTIWSGVTTSGSLKRYVHLCLFIFKQIFTYILRSHCLFGNYIIIASTLPDTIYSKIIKGFLPHHNTQC